MTVDPAGNIYVTGLSDSGGETGTDYATIKYDSSGRQLWIARYNGSEDHRDAATALAVDAQGNVYVTGESSTGRPFDTGYATVKYDPDGNQVWARRYDGPRETGNEVPVAIGLDPEGEVYVTGRSWNLAGNLDIVTLKYSASGTELWVRGYDGPVTERNQDLAYDLAVDHLGNVFVTGSTRGTDGHDGITIKYDPQGEELWAAAYDGPFPGEDVARRVAVDAEGNAYVAALSEGSRDEIRHGLNFDFVTIKYDPQGNQLWAVRYLRPGLSYESPQDLAVDAAGNVYVVGWSCPIRCEVCPLPCEDCNPRVCEFATLKYDSSGNLAWSAIYGGPDDFRDEARAVAVDGDGNVYVGGVLGTGFVLKDLATVKYDKDGNLLWETRFGGPAADSDLLWGLALDTAGNVYVTGSSSREWGQDDYVTIKYVQTALEFRRGDVNADDRGNITDVVFLLRVLFGAQSPPCERSADLDGNGRLELTDAVFLLNYLFRSGIGPVDPFPDCGVDPLPQGDLTCISYWPCER